MAFCGRILNQSEIYPPSFNGLSDENVHVILATNNATSTVGQYLQKIKHMGVTLLEDQIVTSGQAVIYYLRKTYPPDRRFM